MFNAKAASHQHMRGFRTITSGGEAVSTNCCAVDEAAFTTSQQLGRKKNICRDAGTMTLDKKQSYNSLKLFAPERLEIA